MVNNADFKKKTDERKRSIVAIIPARGGSKRIPNKNIKLFAGKPIIAYSIEAAKKSELFKRIIVSTDSEEISKVAKKYGADVPFIRPIELSDDFTGTDDVVLHALASLNKNGESYDYVCCIYATAPFIKAKYLEKGYNLLVKERGTSSFSLTTFPYTIFRALKINKDKRIEMFWPEHRLTRSQDLPEAYHDAGQFYWADVKKYLVEKRFFSEDALPVILPRCLVQDFDTEEDWEFAERMYRANFDAW